MARRTEPPALFHELARAGVSAKAAYAQLQEIGYSRRRQDFLREFAVAAGRPQQVEQRAERAVKALIERAKELGHEVSPLRAEEIARSERAKYTPHKYRPPASSIVKRPYTFADGARYSYRFRVVGTETRGGRKRRVSDRWVSYITDDLVSIEKAQRELMRMMRGREYGFAVQSLVFENVIESTK